MRLNEAKDIRDKARAMETYARLVQDREWEDKAHQIRQRAKRRAGEMLAKIAKAKASPGNQYTGPVDRPDRSKTLAEIGVSKDQSSQ